MRAGFQKRQGLAIPVHLQTEPMGVAGLGPFVGSAVAETDNGLYTADVIQHRDPWRSCKGLANARQEWVDWFNKRRLREPIVNIPPAVTGWRRFCILALPNCNLVTGPIPRGMFWPDCQQ
jgi:hypothetical protein